MFKDRIARTEVSNLKEAFELYLKREGLQVRKGNKRTYIARSTAGIPRKKVAR